jgi:hypothetical protein
VALNRMRCQTGDGNTWTTVRVREMRERLGLPQYVADPARPQTVTLMKTAEHFGICITSVKRLVSRGILPATQVMPGAPWLVPVEALSCEAVRQGVQAVIARRPKNYENYQDIKMIRLPGI